MSNTFDISLYSVMLISIHLYLKMKEKIYEILKDRNSLDFICESV